ncbi:flagellar assembly protein T N-terminal domain-containing protein [Pseudoalteromonas aurantia]|uniref:Flagellar biosynthesis protein FlgT n=2 Tax=Pseudoalteromonas TaxID=53246 RepID=A0A5S3VC44_9GAMM|nr:flagellar assembly protein T N-terminal domain-containing protein [Pseudoalteromonas aurantia]TMO63236.1 flagellar biosynthesis protein FlgT [Pseudoalteromonas aurantia]TMO69457.1 flagellar biosynthesis protein FlgT [Pseudoalteromonas aurantia]TMO74447.1 flagellar biosynthesis protein FlgT [Pseudoalteromonas aurantia]
MKQLLLVLTLFLYSAAVQAEWYEVTGYASILDSNVADARKAAVKDAITQALIFSGATVSSVQTVADGLLSQDQLKIKAHAEIQQATLISEEQSNNDYMVTLHLDIYSTKEQCTQQQFHKQVTVTQSQLIQPHQARLGQIFDIAKASSQRLYNTLSGRATAIKAIPYINSAINVRPFFSQRFNYDPALIETLSNNSNSQYVLFSQITDIAQGKQLNSDYAFWQGDQYLRSFKVDFALYDALTRDQVWQNHYAVQGVWPFEKTTLIDVYSDQFWQSNYGSQIQGVFNKVSQDLNTAVGCMPIKGKVLHIDGDRLAINLGKVHGIKAGQTLAIMQKNNFTTQQGVMLSNHRQTIDQLKVIQVNEQTAITTNLHIRPLSNIQLNDIVQVIIKEDDAFSLN